MHSANHTALASRLADVAQDVIDEAHADADKLCAALAEAQQVTSTTQANYMVRSAMVGPSASANAGKRAWRTCSRFLVFCVDWNRFRRIDVQTVCY